MLGNADELVEREDAEVARLALNAGSTATKKQVVTQSSKVKSNERQQRKMIK